MCSHLQYGLIRDARRHLLDMVNGVTLVPQAVYHGALHILVGYEYHEASISV